MIKLGLKLDGRFKKQARLRYDKYTLEVGVLENKAYRRPLSKSKGLGELAGGPVRRKSLVLRGTIADVSEAMRKRTDFYRKPFKKKSRERQRFTEAFFKMVEGRLSKGRVATLLRAVVRTPILKGDYGRNASATVRTKGFQRFMFDTGQLFRNILARVRSGRVSK